MTEKIDFTNYLAEQDDTVNIAEVEDISEVANTYLKVESEITHLENATKNKKKELQQINDRIVELMEKRGVKEIKLLNGDAVSFKEFYKGSITKDNEAEAFKWLEDNGHGDLIKNIVSIRFGKGENESAEKLISSLEQDGLYPDQKRKVEPMTLNAFIGDQITNGKQVPMELLSVFTGNKVKIKKGK
jgi:hypothetical protein|tara:strand:+ start:258 stop:818 length:561 start_codon:yes stop_codon:yes gene_type:complete